MKVLVFNLSGRYALFTKPYTKNQPQSFIIPPKTAIKGMIGAILGFKRDEYEDKLKNFKYSVVLKKEPNKYTTRFNLMQGKSATFSYTKNPLRNPPQRGQRSPTNFEILKNPSWDIFISVEDNIFNELKERLIKNLYVYEPYLGVVNAFAKIKFIEEAELKKGLNDSVKSFFEFNLLKIKINSPIKFYNELIPLEFEKNRTMPKTKEMVTVLGDFEVLNKKEVENEFFRYKDYSIRFI